MTKRLPLLLLGLFLVLASIGAFLLFRFAIFEKEDSPEKTTEITEIENISGNPVLKIVDPEKTKLIYKIKGRFEGDIQPSQNLLTEGHAGEFIIEGDPLNRKIPVVLKSQIEGVVSFGKYEGDFLSRSTWQNASPEDVSKELIPGETVELVLYYPVPKSTTLIPQKILDTQYVLDSLLKELTIGEFGFEIPRDTLIEVGGVGVVR